jgi:hypothetical protein
MTLNLFLLMTYLKKLMVKFSLKKIVKKIYALFYGMEGVF